MEIPTSLSQHGPLVAVFIVGVLLGLVLGLSIGVAAGRRIKRRLHHKHEDDQQEG